MNHSISLYCGGGGIDEGARQAGIHTTITIDHDKDACATMKANHPNTEVICGRVADYTDSLSKNVFAVFGGPPCPEFSRANTGRTYDMCEVNNFWQAVDYCKPQYFLMENVPDVKKKLYKTSYLLDAADYGVPQNRLRRFFTNLPSPPQHTPRSPRQTSTERPSVAIHTDTSLWLYMEGFKGQNRKEITKPIDGPSPTIMSTRDLILTDQKVFSLKYLKEQNPVMYEKHLPHFLDSPAHTIPAKDYGVQKGEAVTDGEHARKLINEELAVLQGFPVSYKWKGGKTSVRRQIGNAVPPPIIKAFFSQVRKE